MPDLTLALIFLSIFGVVGYGCYQYINDQTATGSPLHKELLHVSSTIDSILAVIEDVKTGIHALSAAEPAIPTGYVQVAQSDLDKVEAVLRDLKPVASAAVQIGEDVAPGPIGSLLHDVGSFLGKA